MSFPGFSNSVIRLVFHPLRRYTCGMKKIFLLMAIIVSLVAPAFAEGERERWDGNRQMAVGVRISPFLVGSLLGGFGLDAGFEFAPLRAASVRANVRYIGFTPFIFEFVDYEDSGSASARLSMLRFNLEGRWYPGRNYLQGWFLSGALQFQRLAASGSIFVNDEELAGGIGMNTLSAFAGLGYKIVFRSSQRAAFMMEPILDLGWRIASDIPREILSIPFTGWMMGTNGLRFSLLFGAAF